MKSRYLRVFRQLFATRFRTIDEDIKNHTMPRINVNMHVFAYICMCATVNMCSDSHVCQYVSVCTLARVA